MGGLTSWKRWALLAATFVITSLAIEFAGPLRSALDQWGEQRRNEAFWRQETRTYDKPISTRLQGDSFQGFFRSAMRDGFRWQALPSFSGRYSLSLEPQRDGSAVGHLHFRAVTPRSQPIDQVFRMPPGDYAAFTDQIGSNARGWRGETEMCVDGTEVIFELAKAGRVLSGAGNAACSKHYAALGDIVLTTVRRFAPSPMLPRKSDWVGPDNF